MKIHIAKRNNYYYGYIGIPPSNVFYGMSFNELLPLEKDIDEEEVKKRLMLNRDIIGYAKFQLFLEKRETIIDTYSEEFKSAAERVIPLFCLLDAPYGVNFSGFNFWNTKEEIPINTFIDSQPVNSGALHFLKSFYTNLTLNCEIVISFINNHLSIENKEFSINSTTEIVNLFLNNDPKLFILLDESIESFRNTVAKGDLKDIFSVIENYMEKKDYDSFILHIISEKGFMYDIIHNRKEEIRNKSLLLNLEDFEVSIVKELINFLSNTLGYSEDRVEEIKSDLLSHFSKIKDRVQSSVDMIDKVKNSIEELFLMLSSTSLEKVSSYVKDIITPLNKEQEEYTFSTDNIFYVSKDNPKDNQYYWYLGFTNEELIPHTTNSQELIEHYTLIPFNKKELKRYAVKLAKALKKLSNDKDFLCSMVRIETDRQNYEKAAQLHNKILELEKIEKTT